MGQTELIPKPEIHLQVIVTVTHVSEYIYVRAYEYTDKYIVAFLLSLEIYSMYILKLYLKIPLSKFPEGSTTQNRWSTPAVVWMLAWPPNSCVEAIIPNVMVFGGATFGK